MSPELLRDEKLEMKPFGRREGDQGEHNAFWPIAWSVLAAVVVATLFTWWTS
jgi:hypothetical protein